MHASSDFLDFSAELHCPFGLGLTLCIPSHLSYYSPPDLSMVTCLKSLSPVFGEHKYRLNDSQTIFISDVLASLVLSPFDLA